MYFYIEWQSYFCGTFSFKKILLGLFIDHQNNRTFLSILRIFLNIKSDQEITTLGDFNICYLQRIIPSKKSYFNILSFLTLTRLFLNQPELPVFLFAY